MPFNVIFFLFKVFLNSAKAQEAIYLTPLHLGSSTDYDVSINGKAGFVYASPIPASYFSFDMNGTIEIKIKAKRDIKMGGCKTPISKTNAAQIVHSREQYR